MYSTNRKRSRKKNILLLLLKELNFYFIFLYIYIYFIKTLLQLLFILISYIPSQLRFGDGPLVFPL